MKKIFLRSPWSKLTLHILLLLPFIEIISQVYFLMQGGAHRLGPDPGKVILEDFATTGIWVLLLGLSLTPVKKLLKINELLRFSRIIGLYAFFYLALHLISYLAFILAWDFSAFTEDIIKRPYMIVGAISILILLVMALTSYQAAVRKLGKRWKKLHRLVYAAAILGIIHEWWQAKEAINEPLLHGIILLFLLTIRIYYVMK